MGDEPHYCECLSIDSQHFCAPGKAKLLLSKTTIARHQERLSKRVFYSGELLDFKQVDSTILQDVSKRVDKAFDRFIVGDSKGGKSGRPRFKTEADYRTMTFSTANNH